MGFLTFGHRLPSSLQQSRNYLQAGHAGSSPLSILDSVLKRVRNLDWQNAKGTVQLDPDVDIVIDSTKKLLYLRDAARILPSSRQGKPVHPSTILRWILNGVRRRSDGSIVRLEALRMPGGWATTEDALSEFFRQQTAVPPVAEHQVDRRVNQDARLATNTLRRWGIECQR